jgi:3-dehydroquinate dehydratase-2
MKKIAVINGPNLNMLGKRQPEIYGSTTLSEIESELDSLAKQHNVQLTHIQSNHEGDIIDFIQKIDHDHDGAIINPGALMMNGYGLLDAILGASLPFVEIHISNIYARETFRHKSIIAHACNGQITGLGTQGYQLALLSLIQKLADQSK